MGEDGVGEAARQETEEEREARLDEDAIENAGARILRMLRWAEAERDEAQTTAYCLLDYLSGSWSTCTHEGPGLSGCPTCEGRWSTEVRRAVQAHRDRVRTETDEAVKFRALFQSAKRTAKRAKADLLDIRARLETVTAERDRLRQRARADERMAHRLSGQVDAAARHLGAWLVALHGPHDSTVDPDALVGRAISALLGGEE